MRRACADNAERVERQLKMVMVCWNTCQRRRSHCDTVVALVARNNFCALGSARCRSVVSNQFHQRIIRIGATVSQKDPSILHGYHAGQLVSQLHCTVVRFTTKHVTKAQLTHLLCSRLDNFLVAITQ